MKRDRDRLAEALAGLKREGPSNPLPKEVVDETLRRLASHEVRPADFDTCVLPVRSPIRHFGRLAVAAAVFIALGYIAGRRSTPQPMDLDQVRETLVPQVAAAIEPVLREELANDLRHSYHLALAGTYVKVKEELTQQYRDEMNRAALQTLAASNAATNELLLQVVRAFDSAKTEDLRQIVRALHEVEMSRAQDKKQLASGLQTLASQLSHTRQEFVRLLVDAGAEDLQRPATEPKQSYHERSEP